MNSPVWDVYVDGIFARRIHYFGYLQPFTRELRATYDQPITITIIQGEINV